MWASGRCRSPSPSPPFAGTAIVPSFHNVPDSGQKRPFLCVRSIPQIIRSGNITLVRRGHKNMTDIKNTTKAILFAFLTAAMILPFLMTDVALADHTSNTPAWQTDKTFDINSSLDGISHVSFTPATDFVDAANVWNGVSSSWWDFTRDDTRGDIDIGARSFGLLSVTLAKTYIIATEDTMTFAIVDFNIWKDFRDINVSPGRWSYDYESVAIHEIGHVAGIRGHTGTPSSPMNAVLPANTVDRTLNSHDISTIRGMY